MYVHVYTYIMHACEHIKTHTYTQTHARTQKHTFTHKYTYIDTHIPDMHAAVAAVSVCLLVYLCGGKTHWPLV